MFFFACQSVSACVHLGESTYVGKVGWRCRILMIFFLFIYSTSSFFLVRGEESVVCVFLVLSLVMAWLGTCLGLTQIYISYLYLYICIHKLSSYIIYIVSRLLYLDTVSLFLFFFFFLFFFRSSGESRYCCLGYPSTYKVCTYYGVGTMYCM